LAAAAEPTNFIPARLASLTLNEFAEEFSGAFNSTVDLPDRYQMFIAVAGAFSDGVALFNGKLLSTEMQKLGGSSGLYSRLDQLELFKADPQRKKSRILVQQLVRSGLLMVTDPEQLRPAIEYHLIRLYLRTGRVVHSDGMEISNRHRRASDVRSVTALRAAVEQAMHYSAAAAELTIAETNDLEWQIARSFCEREKPRCDGPSRRDKPVVTALRTVSDGACPFASTCDGPHYSAIAVLTEPRLADRHAYY
jgi:hypothetical protein